MLYVSELWFRLVLEMKNGTKELLAQDHTTKKRNLRLDKLIPEFMFPSIMLAFKLYQS